MVERERLLQMFIKVRCGKLQVAAWMALWWLQNTGHVQTCFCLYFMAGKMWLRPVSASVGQGGVTATQSGFVSGRGFSSAESPVQIRAKTHGAAHIALLLTCKSQLILEHYHWDPFTFCLFHSHPTIHTTLLFFFLFMKPIFPHSCSLKLLFPCMIPPPWF